MIGSATRQSSSRPLAHLRTTRQGKPWPGRSSTSSRPGRSSERHGSGSLGRLV